MNQMESAVFYQFYPLGMLGAPWDNDFNTPAVSRLPKIKEWIPHLCKLEVNAIYLCPVFESSHHGYDTRDFKLVDRRLGSNNDLKDLISAFHENGIKVILDGVFNHVGRDFWAFKDVMLNRENSPYTSWFHINFSGNSNYNDGFWYDGWEGHYELVKLNLNNPEVVRHITESVGMWIDDFNIDGLRLDVAYSLTKDFLGQLCDYCRNKKNDFWLVGEALHGDYRNLMDGGLLDSVTNYECYKGLYSSFNEMNMFEIAHSLGRQFGADQWTLYKGRHLFNFVDNHDVTRIATILKNPNHLPLIYGLQFTMPGIPCIYYGSEWGIEGDKSSGDATLRPMLEIPEWNELTSFISKLAKAHKESKALTHGEYKQIHLTNQQFVFERRFENESMLVAINIAPDAYTAHFNYNLEKGIDVLSENAVSIQNELEIPPYSVMLITE